MSLSGGVQLFAHDILETSDTQAHPLGALGITKDGRKYRYARAGATALDPGKLTVNSTIVANHENIAVAAAAAVGAKSVTVTLGATAATADQYKDGYLVINDAAGEGVAYLIKGHPAADSAASLTVELDQPLAVALTTSSEATLIANKFADVVISAADQADTPAGVPNVAIAATEFGWLQTGGVCSVLADETLTVGKECTIGSSVTGAVELQDAVAEPVVGIAIQAGVDTEYRAVDLTLD